MQKKKYSKDWEEEGEKEMKCKFGGCGLGLWSKDYSNEKEKRMWELLGECVVVWLDWNKLWLQVSHNCKNLQECHNISVSVTWKLLKLVLNFSNSNSIFWVLDYGNWKQILNQTKFLEVGLINFENWVMKTKFWVRVLAKPNTLLASNTIGGPVGLL